MSQGGTLLLTFAPIPGASEFHGRLWGWVSRHPDSLSEMLFSLRKGYRSRVGFATCQPGYREWTRQSTNAASDQGCHGFSSLGHFGFSCEVPGGCSHKKREFSDLKEGVWESLSLPRGRSLCPCRATLCAEGKRALSPGSLAHLFVFHLQVLLLPSSLASCLNQHDRTTLSWLTFLDWDFPHWSHGAHLILPSLYPLSELFGVLLGSQGPTDKLTHSKLQSW